LELFSDDVEVMNRLAKALIESGAYEEATGVLDRLSEVAPYNNIARKNRNRLEQRRTTSVATARQVRRVAGAPQLFIGESGKSTTTVLRQAPRRQSRALVSPGDPVSLRLEHRALFAYSDTGQYLGQVDPKLGHRLSRLIEGGNTYEAAVIGVSGAEISITIHETHRDRRLLHVASFTTRATAEAGQERDDEPAGRVRADDEGVDTDEEEENLIDEEELQPAWSE
jgi:hypothetical protein